MIYLGILSLLCVFAEAAKLGVTYLPPPNAREAGGHEDDLQLPLEPPYIDPYSDNRHLLSDSRRGFSHGYKPRRPSTRIDSIEDEDQIRIFPDGQGKLKSRFLYGSYSYTGPDNVLVTVTYTADRKKPNSRRNYYEDDYDEYPRRRFDWYDADRDDYDAIGPLEAGIIPTPPSLPRELQKAFAFHRKNYQPDTKKGSDFNKTGKTLPGNRQPWNEQPTQKPIIHQGYSNSRTANTKN